MYAHPFLSFFISRRSYKFIVESFLSIRLLSMLGVGNITSHTHMSPYTRVLPRPRFALLLINLSYAAQSLLMLLSRCDRSRVADRHNVLSLTVTLFEHVFLQHYRLSWSPAVDVAYSDGEFPGGGISPKTVTLCWLLPSLSSLHWSLFHEGFTYYLELS